MKFLKYLALPFFGIVAFIQTGCSDFLDEKPESTYTIEAFYTTQEDVQYAINAIYAEQQDLYDGQYGLLRFAIARCDNTNCENTNTYTDGAASFTDEGSVKALTDGWASLYVIITRANSLLLHIDNIQFTDSNMKNYIKGEAYALRAWAYHNLGVLFGGVPLIVDAEYSIAETKQIGRSTQEETFAQAIKDYQQAISLLPASWDSANLGRITKFAAEASLGRLYMFQKNYSAAQIAFQNVMNSGLYAMEENYADCFTEEKENGKERVWEVQYISGQVGEGQSFTEISQFSGYNGIYAIKGSSAAMQVSTDLLSAYDPKDKRRSVTIVDKPIINNAQNEYSWFIKFSHTNANSTTKPTTTNDWGINLPIIRYTDVCMMWAEATNEISGPTTPAIKIINQVRKRAGLQDLTSGKISSRDTFREAIKSERRFEFAYEGLRWNDLIRWGDGVTVMKAFFAQNDEGNGKYVQYVNQYRYLYDIPAEEITRYNAPDLMYRNPGYGNKE